MDQFLSQPVAGESVLDLEGLIRTALFQTGADVVGYLLQMAADRIDSAYRPQAGETFKEKEVLLGFGWDFSLVLDRLAA